MNFDHADRLNEDGTVTFEVIPSNWRRYNVSPDTYQMFNEDYFVSSELEYLNSDEINLTEAFGKEFAHLDYDVEWTYDDFKWTYNHSKVVRDFAEELGNWLAVKLWDLGLESVSVEVTDSWSPRFYNFQSDGWEAKVTCDPAELRALTEDFDVEDWAHEWYRSVDGFHSFVTGRMEDEGRRADYDAEFRVEALLAGADPYGERDWIMALAEVQDEVYRDNVTIEPDVEWMRDKILAAYGYMDSGFTLTELTEWAREIAPTQDETLLEVSA